MAAYTLRATASEGHQYKPPGAGEMNTRRVPPTPSFLLPETNRKSSLPETNRKSSKRRETYRASTTKNTSTQVRKPYEAGQTLLLNVTPRVNGTSTGLNTCSESTKIADATTDSTNERDIDGSTKNSERTNFADRAPPHPCRQAVVSVAAPALVLPAFPVPRQKP